jgi:hypothetical protein
VVVLEACTMPPGPPDVLKLLELLELEKKVPLLPLGAWKGKAPICMPPLPWRWRCCGR